MKKIFFAVIFVLFLSLNKQCYGAYALVKSAGAGSGSASAVTVDLLSNPTSGNLLVGFCIINQAFWGITTPTGFTLATIYDGNSISGALYYKISAGTEQTITFDWVSTGTAVGAWYGEFSGFTTPTLDVSAENETNVNSPTQSVSSGTTASTTVNDTYALAFFGGEIGGNIDGGRTYTNSFTELAVWQNTSTSRPGLFMASKTLVSTGTVETTYATTDTGDDIYAAVLVFRSAVTAARRVSFIN